jgi:hypothetical protein
MFPGWQFLCYESLECLPGISSRYFLSPLVTVPEAPATTGITKHFIQGNETTKNTQPSQQADGFKEVSRRKRLNTQETAENAQKPATLPTADTGPKEVPTRNIFAPLRMTSMDTDFSSTETKPQEVTTAANTEIPTSTVNLIQLQKQLKNVVKEDFEFYSTKNGTRIITRGIVNFLGVKSHIESHNASFFTFFPKSEKLIKTMIRYLPLNTPAEDICDDLASL